MPTTRYYTLDGARRALSSLPKELQSEVRRASKDIAGDVARSARGAASVQGGLAYLVGQTIRAVSDRFPTVSMGSGARLPRSGPGWSRQRSGPGQTINDVWGGAEFGSKRHRQFRPWLGNGFSAGYFLYPTVRARGDEAFERWVGAVQAALDAI